MELFKNASELGGYTPVTQDKVKSSLKRKRACCKTCEGSGGVGLPDGVVLAHQKVNGNVELDAAPPRKKFKMQASNGTNRRFISIPTGTRDVALDKDKGVMCCATCEGFGGIGLPSGKWHAQVQQSVQLEAPPIWHKWRQERTRPRETGAVGDDVIQNPAWWYAQVCLACLKAVQHRSLHDHLLGSQHKKRVMRNGLRPIGTRQIPILVSTANQWLNSENERMWGKARIRPLKVMPKEMFLYGVAELHVGLNCLVLGEQDFSFSNILAGIVGGLHVIGTSYLSNHNPSIPDAKSMDDGAKRFHKQKCLGSMDGDLARSLAIAWQNGVRIRFNVDAQNIEETLLNREPNQILPFDRIIFPFPRVSLVRGCDPNNSVLIKKFLASAIKPRCLAQGGLVQMIILENQFREWDILHIAEETGFRLCTVGSMNFDLIPYQARDVTGKRIRSAAMNEKTIYLSFARDFTYAPAKA